MALQLGIIPAAQFSPETDPYLYNSHLRFPPGMNQLTIQPLQPDYPTSGDRNLQGVFDSSWWQNRKWLALGLVALLGVGTAALATKILR